jgi:hypothetical protein
MTSFTEHIRDSDVVSASDGYTVILVVYCDIGKENIAASLDANSIAIVSSG